MTAQSRPEILQIMADGRPGGGATMLVALSEALIQRGWAVHIVTEAGSELSHQAIAIGATVTGLSFFRSRFDRGLRRDLTRLASQSPATVAHIHGSRAMFASTSLAKKIPSVYTVHGYHLLNRGRVDQILSQVAERRSAIAASCVVHVSDEDARLAHQHRLVPQRTRSITIRNGIEVPRNFEERDRSNGEPLRILSLSRLVEQKDPLLMLDVMEQGSDDWKLELLGGGEMESLVRSEVTRRGLETNVSVLGAVPREVALEHLRRSHVLLNTSRWEGLPLAPLEAMANGAVVVAPDLASFREVVSSDDEAFLVSGRDPADYCAAISRLSDNDLRKSMSQQARRRIEEQFNWDRTRDSYLALYESLHE